MHSNETPLLWNHKNPPDNVNPEMEFPFETPNNVLDIVLF